jgi:hypothetical protein
VLLFSINFGNKKKVPTAFCVCVRVCARVCVCMCCISVPRGGDYRVHKCVCVCVRARTPVCVCCISAPQKGDTYVCAYVCMCAASQRHTKVPTAFVSACMCARVILTILEMCEQAHTHYILRPSTKKNNMFFIIFDISFTIFFMIWSF